jgi:hypothetical protein
MTFGPSRDEVAKDWRKLYNEEVCRSSSVNIEARLRDGRLGFDYWQGQ